MHPMNLLYLDTLIVGTVLCLILAVYFGTEVKKYFSKPHEEESEK
jgi:hypothetical protein